LTASYIFCILSVEHKGDVAPKSVEDKFELKRKFSFAATIS